MKHFNIAVLLLGFLGVAASVNLIAVFAPETGFDALWYHLTISKIYLTSHFVFHIPGGLLYYSAMPRLVEVLNIPLLSLLSDTGPHLLSFSAGIGAAVLTYLLARVYVNKTMSLLAATVFYVTPLVGWLSGSGYIDLIVTFWQVLAFYLLVRKRYWLVGLVLGLAVSTKSLQLATLLVYFALVVIVVRKPIEAIKMALVAILVGLPWYLLDFLNTGSPIYPIAAGLFDSSVSSKAQLIQPLSIVGDYWKIFLAPDDIISPIFLLIVPFGIAVRKKILPQSRLLVSFFGLSYLVWWLIPRTGGGRFILPFLPVWAVLVAQIISAIEKRVQYLLICSILIVSVTNLVYRFGAEYKLINYLLGKESKQEYLCQNFDFSLGNFYDCDGYFSRTITAHDLVYVKGVHNLFYVNFPFVDETYYRGQKVNYILIQGGSPLQNLPYQLTSQKWQLVYNNSHTRVKLYKLL